MSEEINELTNESDTPAQNKQTVDWTHFNVFVCFLAVKKKEKKNQSELSFSERVFGDFFFIFGGIFTIFFYQFLSIFIIFF